MTKEKQIEEMAKAIEQARIKAADTTNSMNYGFGGWYAKELYNVGYRKASDTVQKMADILLEDIERALESNYKVIKEHADKDCEPIRELVNRVKGKIDALRGLEDLIYKTGDAMLEGKK